MILHQRLENMIQQVDTEASIFHSVYKLVLKGVDGVLFYLNDLLGMS